MKDFEGVPISEQPMPGEVHEGMDPNSKRYVMISGFPSRAMAKAYYAWLADSGMAAAHEAFGTWCDAKGYGELCLNR